ncbi:DNA-binding protein [Baekduia soli]|uniref:DNA-binding protein n=1 Tax=Baekduia soli TaxID=496014 RepID=A0A5B8U5J4_9ACTN|nr:OB-fold domain-containing protein [Baekduia soli]QEC48364.1 DNA-binding protein [Baekduia soli]
MSETPDTTIDLPEPSELLAAHRGALADGRLTFQRCSACQNAWLPPRDRCPRCLADTWAWETASGRATVVSWVVYHRAYHPAFADRVPYNVVLVDLEEGPRMLSTVIGIDGGEGLAIDLPLQAEVGHEGEVPVARFRLAT